jgi:hypothetical protein
MLLVLNNLRKDEEQRVDKVTNKGADDDKNTDWVADSSQWTGR